MAPHLGDRDALCQRYGSICSDSLCNGTLPKKRFATIRNSFQSSLKQTFAYEPDETEWRCQCPFFFDSK